MNKHLKNILTIAIIALTSISFLSSCDKKEKEDEILNMVGTTWTASRENGECYLAFRANNVVEMEISVYGQNPQNFELTYQYNKPSIKFYENGTLIGDGTVSTETMTVDFYGVTGIYYFNRNW